MLQSGDKKKPSTNNSEPRVPALELRLTIAEKLKEALGNHKAAKESREVLIQKVGCIATDLVAEMTRHLVKISHANSLILVMWSHKATRCRVICCFPILFR